MSKWIKKGDKVVVVAGNDKGRTGTVLKKIGDRVVIQGINIHKKHAKRRTQTHQTPTILEIEVPVHISNVQHCDEQNKPIKLKARNGADGAKELYYFQDKKEIIFRTVKKTN